MGSAEREVKSFYTKAEKLDLKQVIRDGFRLPDELIQPLLGHFAIALIVNVATMRCARQLSINEDAKWNGGSSHCRSHDEMKIAGVKTVRDSPAGRV
jgi:hypothetical protein